jgi:hypothetical protein
MLPHERSLVKRLKDRPFALLGVNADDNREGTKKRLAKEQITWRNFWDGGVITKQYRVQYFPTIYVLDPGGVIRYRDVRGEDMDRAVEELLAEAGGKK